MIATILLSLVIFGYAGKVLYRMVKKGSCSDCHQKLSSKARRENLKIIHESNASFIR